MRRGDCPHTGAIRTIDAIHNPIFMFECLSQHATGTLPIRLHRLFVVAAHIADHARICTEPCMLHAFLVACNVQRLVNYRVGLFVRVPELILISPPLVNSGLHFPLSMSCR